MKAFYLVYQSGKFFVCDKDSRKSVGFDGLQYLSADINDMKSSVSILLEKLKNIYGIEKSSDIKINLISGHDKNCEKAIKDFLADSLNTETLELIPAFSAILDELEQNESLMADYGINFGSQCYKYNSNKKIEILPFSLLAKTVQAEDIMNHLIEG